MDALTQELRTAIEKGARYAELETLKQQLCKKHGATKVPKNISLNVASHGGLVAKPMRTQSGVAPVAIMTAPIRCPHGTCTFCPGGPSSPFGDVPQSYTGREPASMRAARNNYDAYLQVFNRLQHYIALGHSPEKVELIIMGGTFPSMPEEYQDGFVTDAFSAMNDFSALFFKDRQLDWDAYAQFFEMPHELEDKTTFERVRDRVLRLKAARHHELADEQRTNESAAIRCVASCVETKPDWCFEPHINTMLSQGVTRVELGVQTLRDDILKATNRGHSIADSVKATQLMRDSFLKIGYHIMPGLPGSDRDADIAVFRELFDNPDYKPDALKIYPALVVEGTALYQQWKRGEFKPLSLPEAADIIAEGKRSVPQWCRVMRVQRDIPTYRISGGVKNTNLRQYVADTLKAKKISCKCIRCREPKQREINWDGIRFRSEEYEANQGTEIFLSATDSQDILLGFCRLRLPAKPFRPEITERSAGIRELHVYGKSLPLGSTGDSAQHHGIGRQLLEQAERIAVEKFDAKKLLVISGVGVREYYERLGYVRDGPYMSKRIA
ncbi:tRNA uridine(34) 5-carboxymethylaminomethyl modification radical SAM/GNAT enzyme Elp3 [Candidatus Woesearchaeota archaeon]|nr:tRNA uridine(34) 5-carboxymethylaminomethyl modification radical SAM/GNAT enzyme Elp3 [Candidatus Woesearchaeota archaeon]